MAIELGLHRSPETLANRMCEPSRTVTDIESDYPHIVGMRVWLTVSLDYLTEDE